MTKLVQEITIPKFKTHIVTSESTAPKYFGKYDYNGVSRDYSYSEKELSGKYSPIKEEYEGPPYDLPAPKSKLLKVVSDKYDWDWYNGYMVDGDRNRILANPRSAGKEKKRPLLGNQFIGGQDKGFMVKPLQDSFIPHIRKQMDLFHPDDFPLAVKWYHWTVPKQKDASNLFFYYKYFEDALVKMDILPDDTMKYISCPPSPILMPIEDMSNRKLKFKFFRDTRDSIKNHPFWNE